VALLGSVKEELLEEMYRRVAAAGYPGLRPSHGCVFATSTSTAHGSRTSPRNRA
jgi:hypothetical protein